MRSRDKKQSKRHSTPERLGAWIMSDKQPQQRAALLLGPIFALCFFLLARAAGSPDLVGWVLVGIFVAYLLAVVFVDERARRAGRARPLCSCRTGDLVATLPSGRPRQLRFAVGVIALVLALLGTTFSNAFAFFWLWVGVSHLVAARTGYPGRPEIGALPAVWLRQKIASGCGPWCSIDHALVGRKRKRKPLRRP